MAVSSLSIKKRRFGLLKSGASTITYEYVRCRMHLGIGLSSPPSLLGLLSELLGPRRLSSSCLCAERESHRVYLRDHSASENRRPDVLWRSDAFTNDGSLVLGIRSRHHRLRLPTANHPAIHLHDDECGRGLDIVVAQCPWNACA